MPLGFSNKRYATYHSGHYSLRARSTLQLLRSYNPSNIADYGVPYHHHDVLHFP